MNTTATNNQTEGLEQLSEERGGWTLFYLLCLIVVGVCSSQSLWALTSTDALPRGVRAMAFVYGFAPLVDSSFDTQGELDSLVSPLNRSVTFEELAEFEPELNRLKNVIDSVYPQNIGNQLLHADLYAEARVFEQRYVPALLWGLTDRFSIGAIVPITERKIQSKFYTEVTNQGQNLRELIGKVKGLEQAAAELESARVGTALFTEKIFTENGYQKPSSFNKSGLGDIEFEARYLYYKSDVVNLGARLNLKVPTADPDADLSNLLDRPLGNGHYALKIGLLQDFKPLGPRWILSSALFITHNFEGRERKAIRMNQDQLLPNLNDPYQIESVRKKRGLDFTTDVALSRSFFDGAVWFGASYIYAYHGQDKYFGTRSLDYSELSLNTQTEEHGFELSLELSSIQLFLKEKFPIPGKLVFAWYEPFKGKNAMYAPYGRMDFALLF
jgi:hypothetical protein